MWSGVHVKHHIVRFKMICYQFEETLVQKIKEMAYMNIGDLHTIATSEPDTNLTFCRCCEQRLNTIAQLD
jgi:hypothetical protein